MSARGARARREEARSRKQVPTDVDIRSRPHVEFEGECLATKLNMGQFG